MQIKQDMNALSKYTNVRSLAVVGGKRIKEQRDELTKVRIEVIIATPGRLLDFMGRGLLDLSRVEILVIDEADRMLGYGFYSGRTAYRAADARTSPPSNHVF